MKLARLISLVSVVAIMVAVTATIRSSPIGNHEIPVFAQDAGGSDEASGIAISNPDKFAWQLFAQLNQPSDSGDGTVVWENWALARKVYGNPNEAPKWENSIKADSADRKDRFESLPIQQQILRQAIEKKQGKRLGIRNETQQEPDGLSQFDPVIAAGEENDEVRMNRDAFDTVVSNELYYVEGQEKLFETNKPVRFPRDAKEIKAEWKNLTGRSADELKEYHLARFIENEQEQVWGLVALHITTKDLPNWFWATWEHESNVQRESVVPSRDRWGAKLEFQGTQFDVVSKIEQNEYGNEKGDPYPAGKWVGPSENLQALFQESGLTEEKWNHYVLRGTQVDFSDKFGQPTILANSVIEEGFQDTSSCITCHSKAGIGPRMRRSDEKNRLSVFASDDPPVGDIGLPNPEWFVGARTAPPNRKYLQFDFVWSTIRAQRRNASKSEHTSTSNHPLIGRWTYRAFMNDAKEVNDAQIGDVVLGTGVLSIASVDEFGRFTGELEINESTTEHPWKLRVKGTASFDDNRWLLNYQAEGVSKENDRASENFWHYEYEAITFPSDAKNTEPQEQNGRVPAMIGEVKRVVPHVTGEIAKKLRDGEMKPEELDLKKHFYPAGFTAAFQLVKQ